MGVLIDRELEQRCRAVASEVVMALPARPTLEDYLELVEARLGLPIVRLRLPPEVGSEISGVTAMHADRICLAVSPASIWYENATTIRQSVALVLDQAAPDRHDSTTMNPRLVDLAADVEAEYLASLLTGHLEQAHPAGVVDDSPQAVAERIALLAPLWRRLVMVSRPAVSPWQEDLEPLVARAHGQPDEVLQWLQRRLLTEIYEAWASFMPYLPPSHSRRVLAHVHGTGLSGEVAAAVTEQTCLEMAIRAWAGRRTRWTPARKAPLPGRTSMEAAVRLARWQGLVQSSHAQERMAELLVSMSAQRMAWAG